MTIKKARIILGEFAFNMTNDQIQTILDCFDLIIEIGFQQFEGKQKPKQYCNENRKAQ